MHLVLALQTAKQALMCCTLQQAAIMPKPKSVSTMLAAGRALHRSKGRCPLPHDIV
jgi:hypothetical protein